MLLYYFPQVVAKLREGQSGLKSCCCTLYEHFWSRAPGDMAPLHPTSSLRTHREEVMVTTEVGWNMHRGFWPLVWGARQHCFLDTSATSSKRAWLASALLRACHHPWPGQGLLSPIVVGSCLSCPALTPLVGMHLAVKVFHLLWQQGCLPSFKQEPEVSAEVPTEEQLFVQHCVPAVRPEELPHRVSLTLDTL